MLRKSSVLLLLGWALGGCTGTIVDAAQDAQPPAHDGGGSQGDAAPAIDGGAKADADTPRDAAAPRDAASDSDGGSPAPDAAAADAMEVADAGHGQDDSGSAADAATVPRDAGIADALPSADFAARCSAAGVVRCVAFDQPSELAGTWGDRTGSLPGAAIPEIDTIEKASGSGSLKFTIPSNSPANSSGSYFTNFSDDLATQFDGGGDLFVQWRQRFSAEFINTSYQDGYGWKQAIIGAGNQIGCDASHALSIDSGGHCTSSCTELETVVQNTYQRKFPQMYNSCSGSTSHGPYDPFEQPFGAFDFKLQNARPAPYCLYSQGNSDTYFAPDGNCFGYAPDEWMTFQVEIQIGPRQGDEFKDSHVRLWIAREGGRSEQVFDWGPYNLTAGDPAKQLRFGKVWLLPYHTNKNASQTHPTAYTWYDELIISTTRIADPQ